MEPASPAPLARVLTFDDDFLTLDDMWLIRGTSLLGFQALTAELGADATRLLDGAHLDPRDVGSHDVFLDYRAVCDALERAARSTGAGDFGRRLARRQGLDILGPVGVAARTAPTVGEALALIERYLAVYSPAIAITLRLAEPEVAQLEWRIVAPRPPVHHQAAELALGVTCEVLRLLTTPEFTPTRVRLRHPALTEPHDYVGYFGCPVEAAEDRYAIDFPASVLARPLHADGAVHAVVAEYLSTIAAPHTTSTVEGVRRLVQAMLPAGGPDLETVCSQLAVHPRTLQRQLARAGTSFAALVDDARRQDAERYLRETDMPLGQLAGLLGLSEQSALTRACRRWFGTTPSQVRRADGVAST